MTAIAVAISGSDSGGGAGVQADMKVFSALGVYGASVITALTAQNTRGVTGIHDVPPDFVTAQIDAVFSDLAVNAVKIGMLSVPATIEAVAKGLAAYGPANIVLDPVMVAQSGDQLITPEAVETLRDVLLPMASVITPNLPEAARLLGVKVAPSEEIMVGQGKKLLSMGPQAVLMKGGHAKGRESVDLLVTADTVLRLAAPRIKTQNTHGTGCTLSSAIAAGLAKGIKLQVAVRAAKDYLTGALKTADSLKIGHGHGPVHHFHHIWPGLEGETS